MTSHVTCQNCLQSFNAPPHLQGTSVACPSCQAPIAIPFAQAPPPTPNPLGVAPQAPLPSFDAPQPMQQRRSSGPISKTFSSNINFKTWLIVTAIAMSPVALCACGGFLVALILPMVAEDTTEFGSLAEARAGYTTELDSQDKDGSPVPKPPPELFLHEKYETPIGPMSAYVSPSPGDGKRHPAIIWKFGGFSNSIGETAWEPADIDNDQSAAAFREAGLVMMYPSVRGGNQNPGVNEGLYGEVDDMLAALDHLTKKDYVDPNRIYLGGHSRGGTLVLLVAESTDRFRSVVSFGPVESVTDYGDVPYSIFNRNETRLRAPARWLHAIKTPTFVFEGDDGNADSLLGIRRRSKNDLVHCYLVNNTDHFGILGPVNRLVATKAKADTGASCNIEFTQAELDALFR